MLNLQFRNCLKKTPETASVIISQNMGSVKNNKLNWLRKLLKIFKVILANQCFTNSISHLIALSLFIDLLLSFDNG